MNSENQKNLHHRIHPQMTVLITPSNREKKIKELFRGMHIPIFNQIQGEGTAPSEIMDIFGLGGTARLVTISFLPKYRLNEAFLSIEKKLQIHQKGGGIVFSIPVTGMQGYFLNLLDDNIIDKIKSKSERAEEEMKENADYSLILVGVSGGYSYDVVKATRSVGMFGGTIIKGNRICAEEIADYIGIARGEEQDFVMILAPKAQKSEIMTAISNSCGITTPAHGIVLSLPVSDVLGLKNHSDQEQKGDEEKE